VAEDFSAADVAKLRAMTGAGLMDCKKALQECNGDFTKAVDWLRKRGKQIAEKKAERETKTGAIVSYIHPPGRIGVLLEMKCETDFVARNDEFQTTAKDLCMHIAAANPVALAREQVPADVVTREREVYAQSDKLKGKPEAILGKIVDGMLDAFFKERCLLEQPFVKDPTRSVKDVIQALSGKTGENVQIARFTRYELGEAAR
jgi:elongation factor Ts